MYLFKITSGLPIVAGLIWVVSSGGLPVAPGDHVEARSDVNLVSPSPSPQISPPQNDRQTQWEDEKLKLLQAEYPLTSSTRIDVDGDKVADTITYSVKRWEDDFEGRLTITSSKGKELWDHEFFMASGDLAKFLAEVLEYKNSSQWVSSVFTDGAPYAFEFQRMKIKADAVDGDQIEHAEKVHKSNPQKLKGKFFNRR